MLSYRCLEQRRKNLKIKLYESFLPVCSYCKKIRDDGNREPGTGPWYTVEEYMNVKGGVGVTSGICPECKKRQLDELK